MDVLAGIGIGLSGPQDSMSMWLLGGVVVCVIIGVVIYLTMGRAETRPIKQGFYGGAITGSSNLSCGRMSSEAESLYSLFASKTLSVGEECSDDLRSLKNLLSKLCCLKQDLMAPQQTITATKEMGFATHQDIQPLGDLVGRCFSKTIPERDLSLQFEKWHKAGSDLIHRLCTAGELSEKEVVRAESLFDTTWKDAQNVATTQCIGAVTKSAFEGGAHDPEPQTPTDLQELRPYDGLY